MFNDFRARMDWCVENYDQANHRPIAAFDGDTTNNIVRMQAIPGQTVELDGSATTDPDGDAVEYNWWVYNEAGTYDDNLTVSNADEASTEITIPDDALNSQIHVILEVQDDNDIVTMYDYRRVVIDVVDSITSTGAGASKFAGYRTIYRAGVPYLKNVSQTPFELIFHDITGAKLQSSVLKANEEIALKRGGNLMIVTFKVGDSVQSMVIHPIR